MKFKCAYDELVDIDSLIPNPRNTNVHPDRQIELLAKIIGHQGQRAPVVVSRRSGFITKGHGRVEAMKLLGWSEVAVDYQDYASEAEEFQDMNADNEIARLASLNEGFLIEQLKELDMLESDFELLGLDDFSFEAKEIENSSAELNLDEFDGFQHECPKCGFEWDDSGRDNA